MSEYKYRFKQLSRAVMLGIAAILMLGTGTALAADTSDYRVVDGVLIYYAVLPAEMVRAYPKGSPEARMHGGVPGGKHVHHIQVALFDSASNERITDAQVTATISEVGFFGTELKLEPFLVAGYLTYGNYFEFSKLAPYAITIRLEQPASTDVVEVKFEYRHH
ncbi:MAG: hypothetical protein ACC631_03575 [Halocynthiibacter sp.]